MKSAVLTAAKQAEPEFHAESDDAKAKPLSECSWFRPTWRRKVVEEYLASAGSGSFIVRSSRKSDTDLVVSVCIGDGTLRHMLLTTQVCHRCMHVN